VAKRRGLVNGDQSGQSLSNITKGEAANIIARLKHGAKVREVNFHMFRLKIDIDFDPEKVR
jgi:hypothetical protein